jgi:hypothetical protein
MKKKILINFRTIKDLAKEILSQREVLKLSLSKVMKKKKNFLYSLKNQNKIK